MSIMEVVTSWINMDLPLPQYLWTLLISTQGYNVVTCSAKGLIYWLLICYMTC